MVLRFTLAKPVFVWLKKGVNGSEHALRVLYVINTLTAEQSCEGFVIFWRKKQ